jgi:hypothetical protein
MELSLNDLHVGSLYRWVPTDYRSLVPWFDFENNTGNSGDRPKADTILLYLGTYLYHTRSVAAHIFLIGDRKYAVWNTDFIYGLRNV